jgi:uncharacterized protein
MAIRNYDEDEFQRVLYSQLSPSEPISSIQLLKGREKTLQQIRQALLSPGRHVFIFGDRGVGKTSLAQTAATLHQSADNDPIILSCASPFFALVRDLVYQCENPVSRKPQGLRKTIVRVGLPILGAEQQYDHGERTSPEINTINQAISAVRSVLNQHSTKPVIILDEFDLVPTDEDKRHFADFVKQVSGSTSSPKIDFYRYREIYYRFAHNS